MNIRNILDDDSKKFKNKGFIFEKKDNVYVETTYDCFINKSKSLATYLSNNGIVNKNVLLIGKNSTNIMIADTAVTIYNGVSVSINRDTKSEELLNIIDLFDISAILYTNEQEDKMNDINIFKLNLDKFNFDTKIEPKKFKKYDINECSKIYFSSGTTSKPKGVKHSLKSIFAGWEPLQMRTKFTSEDKVYLFLPIHHTYANVYNFYYSFLSGMSIYLSSGVDHIFDEIREVNPSIFCAVPLIFERAYQLLGDNIKYAFGNNIKFLFVGGAPLSIDLRNNYKKNGLELLNAYALTETASSFSIDYPGDTDSDSVGTIFENLDVKIIDEENGVGEIVVKGDAVFLGYIPEVENIFTEDGYFKTGDIGYIKDNKLYLKGRKKRVLIGSNGENIYPKEIEDKLKGLDSNINAVNVSLNNNKIEIILFLEDKNKSDIDKVIELYNSKCVQKNKIYKYKISNKKNNEKLL